MQDATLEIDNCVDQGPFGAPVLGLNVEGAVADLNIGIESVAHGTDFPTGRAKEEEPRIW